MNKVMYTLILCITPFFLSFAQSSSQVDSLQNALEIATSTEKVDIWLQLCRHFRSTDPAKAKEYAEQALSEGKTLDYQKGQADAYTELSILWAMQGNYEEAEKASTNAIEILQHTHDDHGIVSNYNTLGVIYRYQGKYAEALDVLQKSLEICKDMDFKKGQHNVLNNLGSTYKEIGDYPTSINYYLQGLQLSEEINDLTGIAATSNNLGTLYDEIGEIDKALTYYQTSLEAAEQLNHQYGMSTCLANIGRMYLLKKDNVKAQAHSERGLGIARTLGNKKIEALCIENFAIVHLQQENFEVSNHYFHQALELYRESGNREEAIGATNTIASNYLSLQQYEKALQYADTALEEAKVLGTKPHIRTSLANLSDIHAAMGDYPQAYQYHVALMGVKDSLLNEEKTRQIAELQTLYETEKKEKEIVLLEKQKAEQRFQFIMIGGSLAVALLIGFLLIAYQRVKIRKNRQLLEKNKQVYETHQALTQAELENAKLKEKELQQALEFKNKELTTHTLNLVQKNNIMEELKSNINTVVKDADGQVAKKLNSLKRLVDYSFHLDKDWEEFRMHFEQVHKDFFTELLERYPSLTPAESRLCALIKLNLNTKEIATIMGITPDSVKIARYRLRKKLGLSTEENLTEFIINFDRNIGVHA